MEFVYEYDDIPCLCKNKLKIKVEGERAYLVFDVAYKGFKFLLKLTSDSGPCHDS